MYMPSTFGGPPAYGGFGRMRGAAAPVVINTERHLFHSEILDRQVYEKKRKLSNLNMSGQSDDDDDDDDDYLHIKKRCHLSEEERSDDRRSHISRERSVSCSEESILRRLHKRHFMTLIWTMARTLLMRNMRKIPIPQFLVENGGHITQREVQKLRISPLVPAGKVI
ncbi:uncharacterized protein LOC123207433 [Mangifera indica]|uniref:uncharacterized protein LOC123207433 n=1 Tax=Mangifera indica TaxID=29780 RepID=UPI001CFA348B|nr:uncharacterized protein LOC123207433 [Mangifera indica]